MKPIVIYPGRYGETTEVWIQRHVAGLRRYRPTVVTNALGPLVEKRVAAVRIIGIPEDWRVHWFQLEYLLSEREWPTWRGMLARRFRRAMRQVNPSLLHVHFLWNARHVLDLLTDGLPPLLVTCHGTDVNKARVDDAYRASLEPVFARARCLIAVSGFIAGKLDEVGCPPQKIRRLYLGVPIPREPSPRLDPSGEVLVTCVAAFREVKGHRYLLDAFANAARMEPRLRLRLVGDGPLRQAIQEQVRRLGLTGRVDLTGFVSAERVQHMLQQSDIYAQHSVVYEGTDERGRPVCSEEGLSVACVEAAANGLPLVCSRTGGIPEICRDGENGFLVAAGDPDAMSERIVQLAQDRSLRARMGQNSINLVKKEFDLEIQLRKLEDLYDELTGADTR